MTSKASAPFDLEKLLNADEWVTNSGHTYQINQLWFPLSTAVDKWDQDFHALMLHDATRMKAFSAAVDQCAKQLSDLSKNGLIRVLDIGTGSGIWAYRCFKRLITEYGVPEERIRIFALEKNEDTFNTITKPCLRQASVLSGEERKKTGICALKLSSLDFAAHARSKHPEIKAYDKELVKEMLAGNTKLFDAIICECIGGMGDNEGIIEIMSDAVNLARKDAIFIPFKIDVYLVPVVEDMKDRNSMHATIEQAKSGDADKIHTIRGPAYAPSLLLGSNDGLCFDVVISNAKHLAEPKLIKEIDFEKRTDIKKIDKSSLTTFVVKAMSSSDLSVVGLKCYFVAHLAKISETEEITLDISVDHFGENERPSDCWKHIFLPLEEPIDVKIGDVFRVSLNRLCSVEKFDGARKTVHAGNLKYTWAVERERPPTVKRKRPLTLHARSEGYYRYGLKAIENHSAEIERSRITTYDRYRNVSLLSDVLLGLCVMELFALAVGHESHLNQWVVQSVTWHYYLFVLAPTFILGGLILNLVRVIHSFAVLGRDPKFMKWEEAWFTKLGRKKKCWQFVVKFLLAVVVLAFVFLARNPEWLPMVIHGIPIVFFMLLLCPIVLFAILGCWDWSAHSWLKTEAVTDDSPWVAVVKETIRTWLYIDIFFLGAVLVAVVTWFAMWVGAGLEAGWHEEAWQRIAAVVGGYLIVLLVASFFYDYWKNSDFYSGRLHDENN